jgi:2'-5' RNA ligase
MIRKDGGMYYALVISPDLSEGLAESIEAIRGRYDPTSDFTKPHITVMFPIPGCVGERVLVRHIKIALSDWVPFNIRLGGFHKSPDHWLFLTLTEGASQVKRLNRSLYTGILAEYRRGDIEFVPHIGLGLFIKQGRAYDWRNPKEPDFDRERYEEALRKAKALPLPASTRIEILQLMTIPDGIIDWTTGKRASIPVDSQIIAMREFRLGR